MLKYMNVVFLFVGLSLFSVNGVYARDKSEHKKSTTHYHNHTHIHHYKKGGVWRFVKGCGKLGVLAGGIYLLYTNNILGFKEKVDEGAANIWANIRGRGLDSLSLFLSNKIKKDEANKQNNAQGDEVDDKKQ